MLPLFDALPRDPEFDIKSQPENTLIFSSRAKEIIPRAPSPIMGHIERLKKCDTVSPTLFLKRNQK